MKPSMLNTIHFELLSVWLNYRYSKYQLGILIDENHEIVFKVQTGIFQLLLKNQSADSSISTVAFQLERFTQELFA